MNLTFDEIVAEVTEILSEFDALIIDTDSDVDERYYELSMNVNSHNGNRTLNVDIYVSHVVINGMEFWLDTGAALHITECDHEIMNSGYRKFKEQYSTVWREVAALDAGELLAKRDVELREDAEERRYDAAKCQYQ